MAKTKFCLGLSDISDSYDGMIIDLEGVLHDGRNAFEGVIECLKELRKRKKYIILLSNAADLSSVLEKSLKTMGIRSNLYDEVMTSAQFLHNNLQNKDDGPFDGLGDKCFLYAKGQPAYLENIDVEIVDDMAQADFILMQDFDLSMQKIEDVDRALRMGVQKRLPAFCLNPGSRSLLGGNLMVGANMLALKYQDFGGVVHYIGKPHKIIFDYCKKEFQKREIYPGDTVVIGDTMAHDVVGGSFVNIDTGLVKTGIHKTAFRRAENPAEVDRILNIMVSQHNSIRPTYLIDKFHWGNPLPDRKHRKRAQPSS